MARAESRSASSTRTDTTIQTMPVTTNTHHFGEFRATSSGASALDWTVVITTSIPTLIAAAVTLVSHRPAQSDHGRPGRRRLEVTRTRRTPEHHPGVVA